MNILNPFRQALAGAALLILAACGGGGGGSDTGTLRLALTDAPACGFDQVNVTVQKVRVHQSANAADTDSGWSEIVLSPAKRVDLLTLTNGALTELGQTPLPPGKYTQLRLVLGENSAATPLANSVVLSSDHSEVALTTPSGQQSGVKIAANIDIAANQMADFVLDFDACKSVSVVGAGKSGKYLLKPQLRLIPRLVNGVQGFVSASLANGLATATLQQGGVVLRSTVSDSSGRFLLQPVDPGSYTLVVTSNGGTTLVVTSVPVVAETVTSVNTAATPLAPASSATGTLAGSVSTGATPVDASVRATQALASGPVEVAGRPVQADSGLYSYALPVAAPQVASYVAVPLVLAFSADGAAAAKYSLQASASAFPGNLKSAGPLSVTAGGTLTTNFSFP